MKPKVFISYAREDIYIARRLYDDLKKFDVDPWLDMLKLYPGQNWETEIRRAIQQSNYFIVLFSSNSVSKKGYVQKEVKIALNILDELPSSEIFILPILLDECHPIDEKLQKVHWGSLFPSYDDGLREIVSVFRYDKQGIKTTKPEKKLYREIFVKYINIIGRILIIIPFLLLYTFSNNLKKITLNLITAIKSKPKAQNVYTQFFIRTGYLKLESLSDNILFLHPREGQIAGMVFIFKEDENEKELLNITEKYSKKIEEKVKLYIAYSGQRPSMELIQILRKKRFEVIPILSSRMERALLTLNDDGLLTELKELEDPFLTRSDPYADFNPIFDPTWFYGRDEYMERIPPMLAQGHHVGIFGLRKIGKTSLIQQIQQRFITTPTVFIDCQSITPKAEYYFEEILNQLQAEIRSIPKPIANAEDFRKQFLHLFNLWKKSGQHEPFLIIFDEIDKFFPHKELKASSDILAEYVHLFKILRGMAQSHRCLVTLAIAYRPDVNRKNFLSQSIGENPMYKTFKEEYLGFLNSSDSTKMIQEIGFWRDIIWDNDAAHRVYDYCGGHPLVTRLFASEASQQGNLKHVNLDQVEKTALEIQDTFHLNDIGNYYETGVWERLKEDEKKILYLIYKNSEPNILKTKLTVELKKGLANLEHFGLISNEKDKLFITARLFIEWIKQGMEYESL